MLLPTTVPLTTTRPSCPPTTSDQLLYVWWRITNWHKNIFPVTYAQKIRRILCITVLPRALCELTFSDTEVVTMEASVARMEQRNSSMFVTPVNFGRNCVREELFSMDWHTTNCRNYVTFILVVSGCWWCFYAVLSTWKDFQYLKSITINASFLD